jgi:hypothetical protein
LQFLLTFVPLFFVGAIFVDAGFGITGWICMVLSIAVAFAAYEVPRARQRRLFGTSPLATGQRVLTFDDDGIAAIFPNSIAHYEWQAFARYRETDLSFLLLASPYRVNLWVPKREMSPQQIEELRYILNARLPAR